MCENYLDYLEWLDMMGVHLPPTFAECLTYEMQIEYLYSCILWLKENSGGGVTPDLTEIKKRLDELEKITSQLQSHDATIDQELQQINKSLETLVNDLAGKQDKLTFDNEPTPLSNNPVTSQGIVTYVEKKISEIPEVTVPVATDTVTGTVKTSSTFDSTFTEPVAIDSDGKLHVKKQGGGSTPVTVDDVVTETSANPVKSSGIYTFVKDLTDPIDTDLVTLQQDVGDIQKGDLERDKKIQSNTDALAKKQDKLTFDNEPTALSDNPVKSQGIATYVEKKISEIPETNVPVATDTVTGTVKTSAPHTVEFTEPVAIDSDGKLHVKKQGGGGTPVTVDDVVTETSANPVKSSGIYTFVKDLTNPIETNVSTVQQDVGDIQKGDLERDKKIQSNTDELAKKQNTLTFDTEPTPSSNNPVTSQGIATYVEKKISEIPGTNVPVATDTVTGTVKTSSTFDSTFTEPVAIDSDGKLHVKKQAGGGAVNYMKFARGYTYSQSVVGDEIVIDGMINPMRRGTLTAEINSNTYELNPLPEFGDVDVPMNGIRLECTIEGELGSWKGEVSCSGSITNIRGQYTRTCWLGIPVLYNVTKESYILLRGTGITIQSKTQPTKDLYESDEVDGQATADWTLTVKQ